MSLYDGRLLISLSCAEGRTSQEHTEQAEHVASYALTGTPCWYRPVGRHCQQGLAQILAETNSRQVLIYLLGHAVR